MLQCGDDERLPGSDQCRGAGRDAEPDPHHDTPEVDALAEQADRAVPGEVPATQPTPSCHEEQHQHRRRHDVPPGQQGRGGRAARAQLGPDETGAPGRDQRQPGDYVGRARSRGRVRPWARCNHTGRYTRSAPEGGVWGPASRGRRAVLPTTPRTRPGPGRCSWSCLAPGQLPWPVMKPQALLLRVSSMPVNPSFGL